MNGHVSSETLREKYSETVLRTNRFAISTLTILIILVVIIHQELQSGQDKAKKLRREMVKATEQLERCSRSLQDLRLGLTDKFNSLSTQTRFVDALQPEETPSFAIRAGDPAAELKALEKLQARIVSRLEVESQKGDAERNKLLLRRLQEVSQDLKPYVASYRDCQRFQSVHTAKRREAIETAAKKQAIPTPFGSFDVSPKFGLLALAFAALMTYVSFASSVDRIRHLAESYVRANAHVSDGLLDHVVPAWLHGRSVKFALAAFGRQRSSPVEWLGSVAIHAGWLILGLWLTYWTWSWRFPAVWSASIGIGVNVALLLFAFIALALWVRQFLWPASPASGRDPGVRRVSRRRMLGAIVGSLSLLGIYQLFSHRPRIGAQVAGACATPLDIQELGASKEFVINRGSGVVHHLEACQRHLPHKHNQAPSGTNVKLCLHAGYRAAIHEKLALANIESGQLDNAAKHLLAAINTNPYGFHLYDRLIGLYGRMKAYERIGQLLEAAVQRVVQDQRAPGPRNASRKAVERRKRLLERAGREFDARRALYQARNGGSRTS